MIDYQIILKQSTIRKFKIIEHYKKFLYLLIDNFCKPLNLEILLLLNKVNLLETYYFNNKETDFDLLI